MLSVLREHFINITIATPRALHTRNTDIIVRTSPSEAHYPRFWQSDHGISVETRTPFVRAAVRQAMAELPPDMPCAFRRLSRLDTIHGLGKLRPQTGGATQPGTELAVVSKTELDLNTAGHPVVRLPGYGVGLLSKQVGQVKRKRSCGDEFWYEDKVYSRMETYVRVQGKRRENDILDWETMGVRNKRQLY